METKRTTLEHEIIIKIRNCVECCTEDNGVVNVRILSDENDVYVQGEKVYSIHTQGLIQTYDADPVLSDFKADALARHQSKKSLEHSDDAVTDGDNRIYLLDVGL